MGKKLGFAITAFFKSKNTEMCSAPHEPFCKSILSSSFRGKDDLNIRSPVYSDSASEYSWFTEDSGSVSTVSEDLEFDSRPTVGELRSSDRLFFEPSGETRSLVVVPGEEEEKIHVEEEECLLLKDSVLVAVASKDPYLDFKTSMEEMVKAHGVVDLECYMHDMLQCYLMLNGEKNHYIILDAFLDLLSEIASSLSKD